MLTDRRHRYLTRWNRRAALAVVLALLAWQCVRAYRAWQAHTHPVIIRGTVLA